MNKIFLIFGAVLLFGIMLVSSYTAPTYSSVNFSLCTGYTAPNYNSINFTLGDSDACGVVTNECAIKNGDEWYIPAGCTCYIETQETEMYLNLDNFICKNE
jgi:hypothetical protein